MIKNVNVMGMCRLYIIFDIRGESVILCWRDVQLS